MPVDGYYGCDCDKYNPNCRCYPREAGTPPAKPPRTPKAKIAKAHKLIDDFLAVWQTDIQPYLLESEPHQHEFIVDTNERIQEVHHVVRRLRADTEAGTRDVGFTRERLEESNRLYDQYGPKSCGR